MMTSDRSHDAPSELLSRFPRASRALALVLALGLAGAGACAPSENGASPEADGPGAAPQVAEAPHEVPEYSIEEFLATTSVFGSSFSPDGSKILVSSDESGIFNAYAVPVEGGEPEPLTSSTDDAVMVAGYFPDDERFLYSQDEGGNELNHLYVRETDGSVTDLTPGEELKAQFYGWVGDDESFFLGTTERDPRFFDVYEVAADGYDRTLAFRDTVGYAFAGASPDGRTLAFQKTNSGADSDVFLWDREAGEMRHLTPHEGDVQHGFQAFSPDGTEVYFTTNEGSEFAHLVKEDLATGERETVLRPDWDVWYAYVSEGDDYLVAGINEDARTRLRVFTLPGMEEVDLPDLSGLDVTSVGFSNDDSRLAFYASSGRQPQNLHVAEVEGTKVGEPRRLTSTLSPAIDPEHLVEPEVVRFESYDGVEIPGILYRPHEASAESRVPAVVWVHGGPGGQSRVGYSELIQYLVNHGYGVYAINNRGSSGYGKTFFHMDDRKHGDADLDDVVASKGMLAETGWVDPDRIGILGGSYGGYMTLAALTFRPDAFEAGVDLFGISNWHRTVTNIPPWWESFRDALEDEMGDFDDEEFFKAKSPLFHADSIRKPLMVLQGANDPRVLQVESDQIVEAVRANGVPVEYVLFEDEGHGFTKKDNREEGWRKVLAFLDEHLKGAERLETAPAGG